MSTALERYWRLKPAQPDAVVRALTSDRCSPELAHLLAQRGITTPEEAGIFFRPRLEHLHDPFLMKDMDRAVERIELALGDITRQRLEGRLAQKHAEATAHEADGQHECEQRELICLKRAGHLWRFL